jgi:hypothetical protein
MAYPLICCSEEKIVPMPENKPAIDFLREHGEAGLVSLGCGLMVNRIDSHLRLMTALNLTYYVGIDCLPGIGQVSPHLFSDPDGMTRLLRDYYQGEPRRFWANVRLFPETWVEELRNIRCAMVVCQRVYPHCRWLTNLGQFSQENIISYYGAAGISKWMELRKAGEKHSDDCVNG